jgi:hypothetical protein
MAVGAVGGRRHDLVGALGHRLPPRPRPVTESGTAPGEAPERGRKRKEEGKEPAGTAKKRQPSARMR